LIVQAGTQDDKTYQTWNVTSQREGIYQAYGNSVRVFLTSSSNNHTPRFRVQISSHSSRVYDSPIFLLFLNIFILTWTH
ncbi:hypothetical protein PMAYCL1PPCAC_02052, partial [Pristionchus mayeri]